jgi:hypothetical protein
VGEWTPDVLPAVRRALAEALARGEARHPAARRNQQAVEEVRELYRRSGGRTPRLGQRELVDAYVTMLADVRSLDEFRATPLRLTRAAFVSDDQATAYLALPGAAEIRGKTVPIDYDVEEGADGVIGVARLRLPEKIARTIAAEELPALDRPTRFTVLRGQRGAVRADSLDELQELLDRPWSPDEVSEPARGRRRGREEGEEPRPREERRARDAARELRREREQRGPRSGRQGGRKRRRR